MLNNSAVDKVFQALADRTRRGLVERLGAGSLTVSELAAPLDLTLAAVVQHLQVLEQCGLIRSEKVGRTRTCSLESKGLDVAAGWISERRALWERRFNRLGELLDEEERSQERKRKR